MDGDQIVKIKGLILGHTWGLAGEKNVVLLTTFVVILATTDHEQNN